MIDAPLIDNILIAAERVRLGTKGQSGRLPELKFSGVVDIDGKGVPGSYTFSAEKKRLWIKPEVTSHQEGNSKVYEIECTEEDMERIVRDIASKTQRQGAGREPVTVEQKRVRTIATPEMTSITNFDFTCMERGVVKIGLGAGHLVLGERWSGSEDGDLFRRFIWEPDADKRDGLLHGSIWPNMIDRELVELLSFRDWHVLAIINHDPLLFFCILYGKYTGLVQYTEGVSALLQDEEKDGVVFLIDPAARHLFRFGYIDFMSKKAELF